MNRDDIITEFRERVLPKYTHLAQTDPYIVEKKKVKPTIELRECLVCHRMLAVTSFYKDEEVCRHCRNNETLAKFYSTRIGITYKKRSKKNECCGM